MARTYRRASYLARFRARLLFDTLEDRTLLNAAFPALPTSGQLQVDPSTYAADQILVYNVDSRDAAEAVQQLGVGNVRPLGLGVLEVSLFADYTVEQAMQVLQDHGFSAEPNYQITLNATIPNDSGFNNLWGMHNTGQTGGTADADIDAPEAWDLATDASSIVVAVIDTGVDYTHPDLAANIWVNPGEVAGNGIDDDGNGFVDDIHGADFVNNDGNPMDDHGHGTHVAGTIGGVGNNGIGVAGVAWKVQIMALKFLSAQGSGTTADAIAALNYAVSKGAKISNNSWGGGSFSQALSDAIDAARQAGHIFVAAAGNGDAFGNGLNNDITPHYPSSYPQDNIVAVAATDHNDNRATFSNYGANSVDLGAPGVNIYSTLPNNQYGSFSGTSMATPHVTGALALFWSQNPNLSYTQVISALQNSVDPIPSMQGITKWGGRLNLYKLLQGANQPPIAGDDSFSTNEDTPLQLSIANDLMTNDSDPDGDPISFASFTNPSHGTLSRSGDTLTYTPDADYNGNDSFTYTIQDDKGSKDTATVTIQVKAVNDPPVGKADSYGLNIQGGNNTLVVNAANGVLANDSDVDGDTLTAIKVTDPAQGTLTAFGSDGSFTYVFNPQPGFTGRTDSFTYKPNDGTVDGNTVTVTININNFPVANDDAATTDEDVPVTINVLANDTDGDNDPLTITGFTDPANGAVVKNADNTLTYTPNANFHGTDSFTYTISDGFGGTDTATVSVTINSVNDDPVAVADSATTLQDVPVTIDVLANDTDVDGDTLTIAAFDSQSANGGTVALVGGKLEYTPAAGFQGADTFNYTVSDGNGGSDSATVTVEVRPPLTLVNLSFENGLTGWSGIGHFTRVDVTFGEMPTDGMWQGFLTTDDMLGGDASAAQIENFLGLSSGALTALGNGTATAGSAFKQTFSAVAGEQVVFQWNFLTDESTPSFWNDFSFVSFVGSGVEDVFTLANTESPLFGPSNSVFSESTGYQSFTYTIPATGEYTIGLGVVDASDREVTSALLIDAPSDSTTPNNPPTAVNDSATTNEDTPVNIDVLANDSDPDGDPLAIDSFTQPTRGTVTQVGSSLRYTPDADFFGTDMFTYTISDGRGGTASASVFVTIDPVNDNPVANDDAAATTAGTPVTIDVLANDSDVDGDTLRIVSVTQGSNGGTVVNNGTNVTYTPAAGITNDTFTYTITDDNGGFATANVTVSVSVGGVSDEGLVAHWKLDGNGQDSSPFGSDNSGTPRGDASFGPGKIDGGLQLLGNGYLAVSNSSDINLGIHGQRTIALWFRIDASFGQHVLYEEGGSSRGLNIYTEGGRIYVGGWNRPSKESGWAGTFLSAPVQVGVWNHVALVLDGGATVQPGALRGYLNGVEFGVGSGSQLWSHSGNIRIGKSGGTTRFAGNVTGRGFGFIGTIDDVRVYNRVLSASEIGQLAGGGGAGAAFFGGTRFTPISALPPSSRITPLAPSAVPDFVTTSVSFVVSPHPSTPVFVTASQVAEGQPAIVATDAAAPVTSVDPYFMLVDTGENGGELIVDDADSLPTVGETAPEHDGGDHDTDHHYQAASSAVVDEDFDPDLYQRAIEKLFQDYVDPLPTPPLEFTDAPVIPDADRAELSGAAAVLLAAGGLVCVESNARHRDRRHG